MRGPKDPALGFHPVKSPAQVFTTSASREPDAATCACGVRWSLGGPWTPHGPVLERCWWVDAMDANDPAVRLHQRRALRFFAARYKGVCAAGDRDRKCREFATKLADSL